MLSVLIASAQNLDDKYLLSVIYLKSNKELSQEVVAFFKKDIPKKESEIPFHISDRITFLKIEPFKNDLIDSQIEFTINDKRDEFESFSDSLISQILPADKNNLILNFSKPIDNILVLELTNFDIEATKGARFGRGFRILFSYGQDGLIDKAFWKTFIYN